jgi:hypothetical protein
VLNSGLRRPVSRGVLVALLSTGLTVVAAPGTVAARPTGAPVEVLSERSETTEVFANPNGTFTRREYLRPVWAKTADGSWVRPDATLRRGKDGSIAPVASTFPMTFSGGGAAPFATAARDGTELVLGWPGQLPTPALNGSVATYPDVLPDVDLEVHAEVDGFTHVLVVKNRTAAANPALRSLALTTRTKGLALNVDPATGAVSAKNAKGKVVLGGATPMMWDARPSNERVIHAAVRPGTLELVPDPDLLTGPDVVYPVRIDPSFTGRRNHWTVLRKESGGTSFYDRLNIGSDDGNAGTLRVGRNDVGNTARTLIELDTSGVAGKHIFSARLSVWHAWSGKGCGNGNPFSPTNIRVHPTYGFDSGTTWNTWWNTDQSGWGGALSGDGGFLRRYDGGTGCPGAGTQEFDVTPAVGNGGGPVTLGLMAESESYQFSWKRYFVLGDAFDSRNPFLTIDYNSYPGTPDMLDTDGKGCAVGSGRPFVGTATPKLRARANDTDPETNMALYFDWVRIQADGTYGPVLGTLSQGSLASGATAEVSLPTLDQGGLYAWRTLANDGRDWSANYGGWCEFGVDVVRPAFPPTVSSPLYQDDLINYYGSIGKTADFTFAPNGVSDVAGYEYGWNDPPTTYVPATAPDGRVTRALTPPPPDAGNPTRGGQLTLYVHSLNRAGNRSPLKKYTFLIGSASSPAGEWKLTETAGSTLADSSGYDHPATLSGGTVGTTGHVVGEQAVSFNGTDNYAATAGPVFDTGTSFSVAAWVKLTNGSGTYQTMVSQNGSRVSAFFLQKFENSWALSVATSDADAPTGIRAQSSSAPAVGVWTHLAGVYDRDSGTLRLYVNGVLAGSATGVGTFNATGPLWIGRARYIGQSVDHFAGAISGVQVWDRVLQPSEIAPMGATQVGWWKLDGNGYDDSGQGRDATPANVTWTTDRRANPASAAALNGSARLATAGPALYTDQSFTVSARVRITDLSLYERTAVAQEGNSVAAFYLGLRQDGNRPQWSMQLRPTDQTVCCPWAAVGGTAKLGEWQHLVGVYDAAAARVRLYVDNVKVADVGAGALWNANGPLSLGFGKWAPSGDFWAGDLDDVHVYQGVLPESEITRLYVG